MCVCVHVAILNRMVGRGLTEEGPLTQDLKEAGFSWGASGGGVLGPRQRLKASDTLLPVRWIPILLQISLRRSSHRLDMETILWSFLRRIPLQQNKQMPEF